MSDHASAPETTEKPTDLLLRALEKFGVSEPKYVLVIFLNEDDELHWMRSDVSSTVAVGALENIKAQIQYDWLREGE